ncbi:MAG TPA: hypothetical protein DDW33_06075, partial [Ktedonobacter sp.]|nr:hypothetical protein [Ktedonobacter sp.]
MAKTTSEERRWPFSIVFAQRSTLYPLWGTLSLGLFATGAFGLPTATGADTSTVVTGLFYGGGVSQLGTQALGSDVTVVATLVVSLVMMYALKYVGVLRVSK